MSIYDLQVVDELIGDPPIINTKTRFCQYRCRYDDKLTRCKVKLSKYNHTKFCCSHRVKGTFQDDKEKYFKVLALSRQGQQKRRHKKKLKIKFKKH